MGKINFLLYYFKTNSDKVWFVTPLILIQIVFILSGILIIRYYYSRRRYFALGNKLPGPKPWPIVGNALYFQNKKKKFDLLGMLNHLNSKYGLARFWLGHQLHVIACTPEDAKVFYSSSSLLDRSDYFQLLLEPVFGGGLPTANGAKWKEAKQLLEPVLTYKFLIKPSSVYQLKTDILLRILDKKTDSTFSIYQDVAKCVCDISCEIFSGFPMNLQEEDTTIHDEFEKVGKLTLQRFLTLWQHSDLLFKLTKAGKRYYKTLKVVHDFIKQYNDMYAPFLREQDWMNIIDSEVNSEIKSIISFAIDKATEQDIKDFYLSTVGASVDTTGTTVSFALMMLGKHPHVQQKLYDEICPAAEKGFDDNELRKLSYLDMVIKETFRLFTPIPMSSRKATDDVLFGEHLVPKESSVSLNIFAVHRDPNQYENANAFDPDHFLPENIAKRHPYAFIPFGMGKRKCVGGNFAYIAIRLILAKIIYNYRVECDMGLDDIEVRFYIATKAKKLNYPIRLYRR